MMRIQWDPPRYKQEETLPFIPDEKELDQLIASCRSKRMAAYLQTLKETFADPGEALRLRWIDVTGTVVTINKPGQGPLPKAASSLKQADFNAGIFVKELRKDFPDNLQRHVRLLQQSAEEGCRIAEEP